MMSTWLTSTPPRRPIPPSMRSMVQSLHEPSAAIDPMPIEEAQRRTVLLNYAAKDIPLSEQIRLAEGKLARHWQMAGVADITLGSTTLMVHLWVWHRRKR